MLAHKTVLQGRRVAAIRRENKRKKKVVVSISPPNIIIFLKGTTTRPLDPVPRIFLRARVKIVFTSLCASIQ